MKLIKNWNQDLIYYIDYRNGIGKLIRISDLKVTRSTAYTNINTHHYTRLVCTIQDCTPVHIHTPHILIQIHTIIPGLFVPFRTVLEFISIPHKYKYSPLYQACLYHSGLYSSSYPYPTNTNTHHYTRLVCTTQDCTPVHIHTPQIQILTIIPGLFVPLRTVLQFISIPHKYFFSHGDIVDRGYAGYQS